MTAPALPPDPSRSNRGAEPTHQPSLARETADTSRRRHRRAFVCRTAKRGVRDPPGNWKHPTMIVLSLLQQRDTPHQRARLANVPSPITAWRTFACASTAPPPPGRRHPLPGRSRRRPPLARTPLPRDQPLRDRGASHRREHRGPRRHSRLSAWRRLYHRVGLPSGGTGEPRVARPAPPTRPSRLRSGTCAAISRGSPARTRVSSRASGPLPHRAAQRPASRSNCSLRQGGRIVCSIHT